MTIDLNHYLRPMPTPAVELTVSWKYLEDWLDGEMGIAKSRGGEFDLNPDFQRGHIWTDQQASHYVLNALRGMAPNTILFNSPNYDGRSRLGDLHGYDFVCIDGLQRLTAARRFLANELSLPSGHFRKDIESLTGIMNRITNCFCFRIYVIPNKKELIQFYLDLNSGGTPHSEDEISRVKKMLND